MSDDTCPTCGHYAHGRVCLNMGSASVCPCITDKDFDPNNMSPREEFEQQFGHATDEQWQWLKEFVQRDDGTGDVKPKNDWIPDFEASLDEGDIAVAAIMVVQAITPEGRPHYYIKHTPGLDDMHGFGMLSSATESAGADIQSRWRSDE